jgi:hypothetical protein
MISAAEEEERNEWVAAIEQTINSMKRDDKSGAFTQAGMLWRLNSQGLWKQRWFVLTVEGISFWSQKNGILKQKLTFAGTLVSVELISENVFFGTVGMSAYQFRVDIGRDSLTLAADTMQVRL